MGKELRKDVRETQGTITNVHFSSTKQRLAGMSRRALGRCMMYRLDVQNGISSCRFDAKRCIWLTCSNDMLSSTKQRTGMGPASAQEVR